MADGMFDFTPAASEGDWFSNLTGALSAPTEPTFRQESPMPAPQSTPATIDFELGGAGGTAEGGGEGIVYAPGGGGTAESAGGDSFTGFLAKMGGALSSAYDAVTKGAKTLFTTEETVQKVRDPATGQLVEKTVGGGLNDLAKTLLAGAITSIGSAQTVKWQEERKEKAAKQERQHQDAVQAEKYRRMAYGAAPQLTVSKGILGGG